MSLSDKMKTRGVKMPSPRKEPLWRGPEVDGITFSMLSRFLVCRERFRVQYIEGLAPPREFNHRIEYGQMWHVCEEAYGRDDEWKTKLVEYTMGMAEKYPMQREQVRKWLHVCMTQFAIYLKYWEQHPEELSRQVLLSEQVFDLPYTLPSGRTVRLRGKWDSVDKVTPVTSGPAKFRLGSQAGIFLQENKTKGDVDVLQLQRQLRFDLQTMMYLVALETWKELDDYGDPIRTADIVELPTLGVRYNVVRRPLSGGKGSIVQHKPTKSNPRGESTAEYYARLGGIIAENPEEYFWRFRVDVSPQDIQRFRQRCLDPILEHLCEWWDWVVWSEGDHFAQKKPTGQGIHWQHPFGVRNVLDEGGHTDIDEYLETGNRVGLQPVEKLFTELEG